MSAEPVVDEALASLWQRWRGACDPAARDALIAHHLPYARMMAATLYGRRTHDEVEFDDYFQFASLGLVESVERFDPAHGVQFKTFASKRVQGAILNGLARLTEKSQQIATMMRLRQERLEDLKAQAAGGARPGKKRGGDGKGAKADKGDAAALFSYLAEVGIGLALGVLLEDTAMFAKADAASTSSPEVSYFRKTQARQLRELLRHGVAQLPESERRVIQWHYQQEMSFEDIANRLELSRGRISQLHTKGLARLRDLLQGDARCDVAL